MFVGEKLLGALDFVFDEVQQLLCVIGRELLQKLRKQVSLMWRIVWKVGGQRRRNVADSTSEAACKSQSHAQV